MDNIKEEFNKNKDIKVWDIFIEFIFMDLFLKDNIKKFRDQAKKLEDSDALKEARDKYVSLNFVLRKTFFFWLKKTLERETMKSSAVLREKLGEIGGKVKEVNYLNKKIWIDLFYFIEWCLEKSIRFWLWIR